MASSSTNERGDGFLVLRLERAFDMDLRRRVGMRDWALAVIVVGVAQVTGVNSISWSAFFALLGTSFVALASWYWLFPQLSQSRALRLEAWMNGLTAVAAAFLVAVSGGASSPYIFFFAVIVVFVAAFVERASMRTGLITFTSACALAPIAYDFEQARADDFIPTIVLAVAVWILSGALIALKRSSAVNAELEARRLAYVDPLTGAGTRRAIDEYAAVLDAADVSFAVVHARALGVDEINRVAGHLAGDEVLRRVVTAMREASIDVDQVVRLGGVEFAVILPAADERGAQRWLTRFRERLELANARADGANRVGAVAGAAAGGELVSMLGSAEEHSARLDERDGPSVSAGSAAERADHLHEQLDRVGGGRKRPAFESVHAPASVLLAIPVAVIFCVALAASGGASSVLLSAAILIVTYFATFGTRVQTVVATTATAIAVLAAVIARAPVSNIDQTRTLTVLVTIVVLADTVQRNARKLMIAERRAAELSLVDPQTGLGNRSAFERALIGMIPRRADAAPTREARLEGAPAVIAIDFADYAELRGRLGHRGDDLLLLEVAEALRDALGGVGEVFTIGSGDFGAIVRAHHRQHVDDVIARCVEALAMLEEREGRSGLGGPLSFRYGGAIWSEGMTAADLAAAAVADQPPAISPHTLEYAVG